MMVTPHLSPISAIGGRTSEWQRSAYSESCFLLNMKADGMTILVSTAYMDEGEKCDQILLMHNARILEQASPDALRAGFSDLEEAMIQKIQENDRKLSEDQFAV